MDMYSHQKSFSRVIPFTVVVSFLPTSHLTEGLGGENEVCNSLTTLEATNLAHTHTHFR